MYLRYVISIFYSNRSFALLFVPFIVALFVMMNMYFPYHIPDESVHFGMWGSILPQTDIISQIVAPSLVLFNALLLNSLFNRNDFLERNNYIVSLLYITFLSNFHSFYFLDGFAIAQFLFTFGLIYLFRLNQNDDARKWVFNAAFILGTAATFYPLFILSLPMLFWMIWVMRPFLLRESMLTLIGFVLPLMYGGLFILFMEDTMQLTDFSSSSNELFLVDILILTATVLVFLIFSIKTLLKKMQQGSIRTRKLYSMLLMLSVLSVLLTTIEFFAFQKGEAISLLITPLMFVLPYGFGYQKQRPAPTFFFYVVFAISVGKFLQIFTI